MPMIRRSTILLSLFVFQSTLLSAAEGLNLQKLVIGYAAPVASLGIIDAVWRK
jgi:hypothetical protein